MRRSIAGAAIVWLVATVWIVVPVNAQESNRAGLVIMHGDGTVITRCVSFATEDLSGYEVLQTASVAPIVEATAMGATVCSLDGEGCAFPPADCFCQCLGSPCVYWSYWRLGDDGWEYRTSGPSYTRVRNGDVEGWRWAEGTTNDAAEPPFIALDEICVEPAVSEATPNAQIAFGARPEITVPSTVPPQVPQASAAGQRFGDWLMWAILVLGGAGMAVLVAWRLRGHGTRSGS